MKQSIRYIAKSLGALSEKWLRKSFPCRRRAVEALRKKCGYPPAMCEEILDDLFSELTERKLWALLESELGNPEVLDGFQKDAKRSIKVRAFGPRTITHIFSANVPNPSIVSMVLGLLVKSRNVAKVSSEDAGLLRIYLQSLEAHDPFLSKYCVIQKKPALSDAVIVYGGREAVRFFSRKVSPQQIFIPYGHRMSFGLYFKGTLGRALAKKTAKDLWLMYQRGCLSPLVIFIQAKGKTARDFCTSLSLELFVLGGSWNVQYDRELKIPSSWGNRTALIQSFNSVEQVMTVLKKFSPYLQAVSLEGSEADRKKAAEALSELGANRICRAGRIQKPPLSWHHDGRMNLAPLLRWTDLEDTP